MNLGRLDISNVQLPVESLAAGQRDVKQDCPVATHTEVECTLIAARDDSFGLAENRTHPGLRHVTFERNVRSCQPLAATGGQCNREGVTTDA